MVSPLIIHTSAQQCGVRSRYSAKARSGSPRTLIGLSTALLFALTGCSGTDAPNVAETSWGSLNEPGTPSIEFTDDGLALGNDGCNSLSSKWRLEDSTIYFDEIGATEIACGDVDRWLSTLSSAQITGDTITFSDAFGKEIGSLGRAKATDHE